MPFFGFTILAFVSAILIAGVWRESTRAHLCGTASWNTSRSQEEFHSQFPQYWTEFYSNLTESKVTFVGEQQGSKFSLTSPMGIFDCQAVVEQTTRQQYSIQCFAYGYLTFHHVPYRFLFVHKDYIVVKYHDEGRIELSLNMTFNKVFDLMLSTEKACAKFQKYNRSISGY